MFEIFRAVSEMQNQKRKMKKEVKKAAAEKIHLSLMT